jgi:hypothetical protein
MDLSYQNRQEDREAYYNFLLRNTKEGEQIRKQAHWFRQVSIIITVVFMSSLLWGITGEWQIGLRAVIILFLLAEGVLLLESRFQPLYYFGLETYRKGEKSLTQTERENFLLQKTISANNDWLEISNLVSLYRYHWKLVNHIETTSDFIFIRIGTRDIYIVPKRDFQSHDDFLNFGRNLLDLRNKSEEQIVERKIAA